MSEIVTCPQCGKEWEKKFGQSSYYDDRMTKSYCAECREEYNAECERLAEEREVEREQWRRERE